MSTPSTSELSLILDPTYDEIQLFCTQLSKELASHDIDAVVGLLRGGLIPAVMVSHSMGKPMVSIAYSSKQGNGDNKCYGNDVPSIPSEYKNVLVIDDICDTGHSLNDVTTSLTSRGHTVITASLYYKQESVFEPTFHWSVIPVDSPWIVFPWEKS